MDILKQSYTTSTTGKYVYSSILINAAHTSIDQVQVYSGEDELQVFVYILCVCILCVYIHETSVLLSCQ